jgi:multidrug efflux pump subunit AcrA (membrane-fusion protein)
MSADLEIVSAELRDVLLLPLSTIQSKGAMRFVRTKDGEMRKIKTGTTDGMSIVVLEGLEEGDEVMAAPSPPAEGGRPAGSARAGDPSRDMRRGMRQMGR